MRLRPYQLEAIDAVRTARAAGIRRALLVLPTGTGKSVVFANLPMALGITGATVIVANRDVLVAQAETHFRHAAPDAWIDIEKAERRASAFARIVIASVQSLGEARLAEFLTRFPKRIELLVCDEAHHATSASYKALIHGVLHAHPDAMVVGVTATPQRADRVGLDAVFEQIVYSRDIRWAVEEGWLVPIRSYVVRTKTDLTKVPVHGDDFVVKKLEEAVDTDDRNARVVSAYLQHAQGKRAVVFTVDVAHAHHIAGAFLGTNVAARAVSGRTPDGERQTAYADFRAGRLRVLTCAQLLTEGWDEAAVDVVIQARPMRSQTMYIQASGRALRPLDDIARQLSDLEDASARCAAIAASGKPYATILDVVDASDGDHSLITVASLNGLPPKVDLQGRSVYAVSRSYSELEKKAPWLGERVRTAEEIETLLFEVNAFDGPLVPPPTNAPWRILGREYVLALPRRVDGERQNGTIERGIYGRLRGVMNAHHRDRGRPLSQADAARRLGFRRLHFRTERLSIRRVGNHWTVAFTGPDGETVLGRRGTLEAAFADATSWLQARRPNAIRVAPDTRQKGRPLRRRDSPGEPPN